jgi:1-acyl-sn-glycerol-3-phosphate acyltransferase
VACEDAISVKAKVGEKTPAWLPAMMNVSIYPLMLIWTLVGILLFPLGFAIWKLATGWDAARITRHFIWIYGRVWMRLASPFIRFHTEGLEGWQPQPPFIAVVNHLSFFDTYCMAALPFHNIVFAVRSWPFKMFWYAEFMRLAGYLDVESLPWDECLQRCRDIFERKGVVLFFPEGHRSRNGLLQRFHSGAFRVAAETGVPVVPLCIVGTDRLLPPGRHWLQPANVHLRALAPVDPATFGGAAGHAKLRDAVKNEMAKNIEEMRRARA